MGRVRNQRNEGRFLVALPCIVTTPDETVVGEVVDISMSGCCVRAPTVPAPGQPIQLEVEVALRGVEISGWVTRFTIDGFAIEFDEKDEDAKAAIANLMALTRSRARAAATKKQRAIS